MLAGQHRVYAENILETMNINSITAHDYNGKSPGTFPHQHSTTTNIYIPMPSNRVSENFDSSKN